MPHDPYSEESIAMHHIFFGDRRYKCRHCGGPIKYGARFCPQCGNRKFTWPYRWRQNGSLFLALLIACVICIAWSLTDDLMLQLISFVYLMLIVVFLTCQAMSRRIHEHKVQRQILETRRRNAQKRWRHRT